MREELALKAAILAEKFAPDLSWYSVSYFFITFKAITVLYSGRFIHFIVLVCLVNTTKLSSSHLCIPVIEFHRFLFRYVDVILQLIDKAGDFVSDDIWFRVVQFVTNNEDLQVP